MADFDLNQKGPAAGAGLGLGISDADLEALGLSRDAYLKILDGGGPETLIAELGDKLTYATNFLPSQGKLTAKMTLNLPGNAVFGTCLAKVTARSAQEAFAAAVGEVRAESGVEAGQRILIVDLGGMRTVSAALFSFLTDVQILRVDHWTGVEFNRYGSMSPFFDESPDRSQATYARFVSDVRTERLRITVETTEDNATLMSDLRLVLPDSPRDLEIAINGGPPVWSLPGPTAPGPEAALTQAAWNSATQRLVDLAPALSDATGNPLDMETRDFEVTLTSREAGFLQIEQHELSYGTIVRAQVNGAERSSITFDSEGVTDVALTVPDAPSAGAATSVVLDVAGEFPPERRLPPTGGAAALTEDGAATLVEVGLTSERAMILRLAPESGVSVLRGLRLLLAAGDDGAEMRLLPWTNADPALSSPGEALDDLTGPPVSIDAGDPAWVSLMLGEDGLELDPANPPWIALLLARGTARVGLTRDHGAAMRIGPPSGPWRPMPALFANAGFDDLRFPYRVIGDADPLVPPAPVLLEITGGESGATTLPVDPVPTGQAVSFEGLDVASPGLRLTHLAPGAIDIGPIDIVFDG